MDPATIILLVNAGLTLLNEYGPKLRELMDSGDITPEQQQALQEKIAALRTSGPFSGSEWQV